MKRLIGTAIGGSLFALMSGVSANAIVIQGTSTANTLAQQLFLNSESVTITDSKLTFGEPGGFGDGD